MTKWYAVFFVIGLAKGSILALYLRAQSTEPRATLITVVTVLACVTFVMTLVRLVELTILRRDERRAARWRQSNDI